MKNLIIFVLLFFYSNIFASISISCIDSIPSVDMSYMLKMVTPEKKALTTNNNMEDVTPAEHIAEVQYFGSPSTHYIVKEKKYLTCNHANGIKILVYNEKYIFQKEISLKQGQTCNLRNLTIPNKLIYMKIIIM